MASGPVSYDELLKRTDAPPGSSWGLFTPNDNFGTLNFLTSDCVVAATRCVKRGVVFSLDYSLDAFPGPVRARGPVHHTIYNFGTRSDGSRGAVREPTDVIDDFVDGLYLQGSSHIDALRHIVHPDYGLNGGVSRDEIRADTDRLGMSHWAQRGIVGRGVLIDVAALRESQGHPLDHAASETFGPKVLDEALSHQGTELRPGDMVVLRTDCPRHIWHHPADDAVAACTAGIEATRAMAAWLWDHRIALLAADNIAVEATGGSSPSDFGEGRRGRLHPQLIALLGLAVGELWNLEELAADCAASAVYEFLLVVKPLNLLGAVGSPANATAVK